MKKEVFHPDLLCSECGTKKLGSRLPEAATFYEGICCVCGKRTIVTQSRDYGYPKFTEDERAQGSVALADLEHLHEDIKELNTALVSQKNSKDQAYWERNQLVLLLTKVFPAWRELHPKEDYNWEEDWRNIVFIQTPYGLASWHIHDKELAHFAHLEMRVTNSWDGHTIAEKYQRLYNCTTDDIISHLIKNGKTST